jgi:hypothetical protein
LVGRGTGLERDPLSARDGREDAARAGRKDELGVRRDLAESVDVALVVVSVEV